MKREKTLARVRQHCRLSKQLYASLKASDFFRLLLPLSNALIFLIGNLFPHFIFNLLFFSFNVFTSYKRRFQSVVDFSPFSTYYKEVSDVIKISILIAQARMLKAVVKACKQIWSYKCLRKVFFHATIGLGMKTFHLGKYISYSPLDICHISTQSISISIFPSRGKNLLLTY